MPLDNKLRVTELLFSFPLYVYHSLTSSSKAPGAARRERMEDASCCYSGNAECARTAAAYKCHRGIVNPPPRVTWINCRTRAVVFEVEKSRLHFSRTCPASVISLLNSGGTMSLN